MYRPLREGSSSVEKQKRLLSLEILQAKRRKVEYHVRCNLVSGILLRQTQQEHKDKKEKQEQERVEDEEEEEEENEEEEEDIEAMDGEEKKKIIIENRRKL
jgi:hypothetical protein